MKSLSPSYYPTTSSTGMRCCSTGHPVLADPLTGRTVCSCQIQSGVPAYLSQVAALSGNLYKSSTQDMYKPGIVEKSCPTYVPNSYSTAPPSVHSYYLEHMMAAQSYGAMYPGLDVNSIRRKTTNREATGPLKSWLYQHRKNPYPTKGEKIMLAIISQMTLTQVSTWFANARRRLKKESKMEDKDIDLSDIDVDDKSESQHHSVSEDDTLNLTTDLSDISDAEESAPSSEILHRPCVQRLLSPDQRILSSEKLSEYSPETQKHSIHNKKSSTVSELTKSSSSTSSSDGNDKPRELSQDSKSSASSNVPQPRPKIWSITEIISSPSDSDNQNFAKRQLD